MGSYMFRFLKFGFLVSFLHDISDIFVSYSKLFNETTYSVLFYLSNIGMVVSWGWTRLYIFAFLIYRGLWVAIEPAIYPNWRDELHRDALKKPIAEIL
jgi:hypothetical protein